jgi:hypothetical protein
MGKISICFLSVLVALPVKATTHTQGQWAQVDPAISDWYRNQLVPEGPNVNQSCCSLADGAKAEVTLKDGRYWVTYEACYYQGGESPTKICNRIGPQVVPEEAVLKNPRNPTGTAVVWYQFTVTSDTSLPSFFADNPDNLDFRVRIRCFADDFKV